MSKLDEMNLPIINVAPLGAETVDAADYTEVEDVPQGDCSKINVYVDSVKPADSSATSCEACFDIIFTVGIACSDDPSSTLETTKTYTIVKRIKVDKLSLAKQAEAGQPISVIENKKSHQTDHHARISRLRVLAGLE
jgi:hypothetical protein